MGDKPTLHDLATSAFDGSWWAEPTRILDEGFPAWRYFDGTVLRVVSGGEGDDDSGDDDTDDDGKPPPKKESKDDDSTDYKAEAEKWKAQARKHEDRAKANAAAAKELEDFKKQHMSDQEKAVADAKAAGKAEAMTTVGAKLVDAEIKNVSAGRMTKEQLEALLDGLDRNRFLTDDGDVDTDKVEKFVDGIAPKVDEDDKSKNGKKPGLGQGKRESSKLSGKEQGLAEAQRRFPTKSQ